MFGNGLAAYIVIIVMMPTVGGEDLGKSEDRWVVRGDSWGGDQKYAHCAYRGSNFPGFRNFALGFRLSCVSHISFDLF